MIISWVVFYIMIDSGVPRMLDTEFPNQKECEKYMNPKYLPAKERDNVRYFYCQKVSSLNRTVEITDMCLAVPKVCSVSRGANGNYIIKENKK